MESQGGPDIIALILIQRGVRAEDGSNTGVIFWDLRDALEHLEKGIEVGFDDFLLLYPP